MHMPTLVMPSERYKESYLEAQREIRAADPGYQNAGPVDAFSFGAYLVKLSDYAADRNLEPPSVPSTEWWLVDGERWLGRVSIRHRLNERLEKLGGHIGYHIRPGERRKGYGNLILEMALPKAREVGIHKALLTCDEDNEASVRIIEKHGGKLSDIVQVEGREVRTRRYWIDLDR